MVEAQALVHCVLHALDISLVPPDELPEHPVLVALQIPMPALVPPYCTPSPGFACGAYSINSISGVLLIQLAQASGAEVTVGGVACAANVNASGNKPAEGNIYVTQATSYYPSGGFVTNTMYSGRSVTYQMYCYNNGGVAKGNLGNGFTGYVWMNYTIPGYGQQTQLVATINAKYT